MTEQRAGLPVLVFMHLAALEAWLAAQPGDAPGAWIKLAKKTAPKAKPTRALSARATLTSATLASATLTKAEAIDAALCHGWIDGRLEKYDDVSWLIRFTPRRPGSQWSLRNRNRALELKQQGRMRPSGLAQIEAAMADGRWDRAYASAGTAQVPGDLRDALNKNRAAAAFFKTLSSRNRYAILYRIGAVKKAETRERKIREFVAMLARGETIHG